MSVYLLLSCLRFGLGEGALPVCLVRRQEEVVRIYPSTSIGIVLVWRVYKCIGRLKNSFSMDIRHGGLVICFDMLVIGINNLVVKYGVKVMKLSPLLSAFLKGMSLHCLLCKSISICLCLIISLYLSISFSIYLSIYIYVYLISILTIYIIATISPLVH